MSEHTTAVDEGTFRKEVIESDKPVLVDFWASWCGPCRAIAPTIEEIASENGERFKVAKVDIDENPTLAQTFQVMSIPTLILFKDGKPVTSMTGARPKAQIMAAIDGKLEA